MKRHPLTLSGWSPKTCCHLVTVKDTQSLAVTWCCNAFPLQGETSYPFDRVLFCNIGDCHAMGQQPLTFVRQLVSACLYPPSSDMYPLDVRERAKTILDSIKGGSLGMAVCLCVLSLPLLVIKIQVPLCIVTCKNPLSASTYALHTGPTFLACIAGLYIRCQFAHSTHGFRYAN